MTAGLLTAQDLAERFQVPVSTVMQWSREENWPHVRVGRRYRWTEEQYADIVRRKVVTPIKATTGALPGQTARSAARQRTA